MIAKPEWFNQRKYCGWGITPRSWQGWIYTLGIFVPLVIFLSLPDLDSQVRTAGTVLWVAFVALDLLPIMVTMKMDEREYKNEAIAERNASWFMVLVLVIGILYALVMSGLNHELSINWFMVLALFGGAVVKGVSNYQMDKKGC
jgi:voltage-gated potassium channel Kch